jgi:hypothetical protein
VTKISTVSHFDRPGFRGALIAAVAAMLGACETGSNVLGGSPATSPLASTAAPATPAPQAVLTKVTIAPVIGAPDAVGRGLSQDLAGQIAKHKATVVAAGERSDYTLRGYIVAAKDKANTKVSYIWDVTDPAGKRLNRITGEEIVTGQAPKDPWSAVSPQVVATIAQKSANSFGTWLPTQASAAATPIASAPAGAGASAVQTASVGGAAATSAPRPQSAVATTSAPATGPVTAIVPSVTGAPGDGATSLSKALQSELSKNGVALGGQPAGAYRVEGVVQLSASQGGRQNIQIDWNVKDPQGKKVGTVSQKNEIPEGSLDGAWGTTAGAAAAAAAQGILKLLPR